MRQNINLYLALPHENTDLFSIRYFWKWLLLWTILLLVFWLYHFTQEQILHHKLELTKKSFSEKQTELVNIAKKMDLYDTKTVQPVVTDSAFAKQISFLNTILSQQSSISKTFIPDWIGLAQESTPGVWLTDIVILNKGSEIDLIGNANTPEAVVTYVKNLGNIPPFTQKHISLQTIDHQKTFLQFKVVIK